MDDTDLLIMLLDIRKAVAPWDYNKLPLPSLYKLRGEIDMEIARLCKKDKEDNE